MVRMGGKENACMSCWGKPEGETRLGKTRCRREDDTEMGLKLTRSLTMGWLNFSPNTDKWRAFMNTVMKLQNRAYFDW